MKEQSHKDEMSAALRGDFARLRERGVASTLRPPDRPAAPAPEPDEPRSEPTAPPAPIADEPPEPERAGILGRLFGR